MHIRLADETREEAAEYAAMRWPEYPSRSDFGKNIHTKSFHGVIETTQEKKERRKTADESDEDE